jgi:hypothetical protein
MATRVLSPVFAWLSCHGAQVSMALRLAVHRLQAFRQLL